MEISPALMDAEDSDEESRGPTDPVLVEEAYSVCTHSIQNGGEIPKTINAKLLRYMQECNMVNISDGSIFLARDAVRHGIYVANAKPERSLRTNISTLETQGDLVDMGWTFTSSPQTASIQKRVAMDGNPSSYYVLLSDWLTSIEQYESENLFHHKQGEQYYKTLVVAMELESDEFVDVPPYKKVEFYVQLQQFLRNETQYDPRNDIEPRRKRTQVESSHVQSFRVAMRNEVGLLPSHQSVSTTLSSGDDAIKYQQMYASRL